MRTRLVIFGAVIALVVAACGESDDNRQSSPTTTAASSPTTTAGTSAGSTGLQVGDRVTSKGTQLRAPSNPDTRQIDSEQSCRTYVETPGGQCEIVMMAGRNALWTVDALHSADEESPECCPASARRRAIAFSGGEFRVTEVGDVPIDQQPADLFV